MIIRREHGEGHTSGLRLLRVAARARAEHGRAAVGPYNQAISSEIFDSPGAAWLTPQSAAAAPSSSPCSKGRPCPAGLAETLDDTRWDDEIRAEGAEALSLTDSDVGTPIIQFNPREARPSSAE